VGGEVYLPELPRKAAPVCAILGFTDCVSLAGVGSDGSKLSLVGGEVYPSELPRKAAPVCDTFGVTDCVSLAGNGSDGGNLSLSPSQASHGGDFVAMVTSDTKLTSSFLSHYYLLYGHVCLFSGFLAVIKG
jgi:hypothetical protein